MGSLIEINDTLPITIEQGFPAHLLNIEKHLVKPITLGDVQGQVFRFHKKEKVRIYHLDPVRVFLVQNINGKWLFWGKILIQSQSVTKRLDDEGNWQSNEWETSGTYIISDLYDPDYQSLFTRKESPPGLSYYP